MIVYDKLKTKKYPAVSASKIKDISMHPKREVIEWALASGIASGDKNGNFRPDEFITEAEFWTMMLKMHNIDYEAYALRKKQHWADGAYKIAKERPIPLTGKNNAVYRSQVMTILPAMDGVNIEYNKVQAYVVAKNYMRGITGTADRSPNDRITRADAIQILKDLQPNLKELKAKPSTKTADEDLPEPPIYEVYNKPALQDRMLIVQFLSDGSLTVEGQFSEYVSEELTVQVDRREAPNVMLEKVAVKPDASGKFSVTLKGPYDAKALNVYYGSATIKYAIEVAKGKMNATQYPRY